MYFLWDEGKEEGRIHHGDIIHVTTSDIASIADDDYDATKRVDWEIQLAASRGRSRNREINYY